MLGEPGGRTLNSDQDAGALAAGAARLITVGADVRYLVVAKPAGGRWTLTPNAGSSIGSAAVQLPKPPAQASATVGARRRGRATRTLRYSLRVPAGAVVRFVEDTPRLDSTIGVVRAPAATSADPQAPLRTLRGELRFRPSVDPGTRRTIVAEFGNGNGLYYDRRVVARFSTPPPARPGRPRAIGVTRAKRGISVSWRRVAGAGGYEVVATGADGTNLVATTTARVRHARLALPAATRRGSASARSASPTAHSGQPERDDSRRRTRPSQRRSPSGSRRAIGPRA